MQSNRFSMRILISSALLLATASPAFAYNHARRGPTSPNLFKRRSSSKMGVHSSGKPAGPRVIDSDRATQIQAALIKSGYMTGTPSGHWDAESQSAMQKLQGAQGWQTRLTPDSRALIMLDSARTAATRAPRTRVREIWQKRIPVSLPPRGVRVSNPLSRRSSKRQSPS